MDLPSLAEIQAYLQNAKNQYMQSDVPAARMMRGEPANYGEALGNALQASSQDPMAFVGSISDATPMIRSSLSELYKSVLERRGEDAAKRVQQAADLVPNLEKQYSNEALQDAFNKTNVLGKQNAFTVINPKEFLEYSRPLPNEPFKSPYWNHYSEMENNDVLPTNQYLEHLINVANQKGFNEVPNLQLGFNKMGNLRIMGHEGRHRTAALGQRGDPSTLVEIKPQSNLVNKYENQENPWDYNSTDFIKRLYAGEGSNPRVIPERVDFHEYDLPLPNLFAHGGLVYLR